MLLVGSDVMAKRRVHIGDIIVLTCKCHCGEMGIVEAVNGDFSHPSIQSKDTGTDKFFIVDHIPLKDAIHVVREELNPSYSRRVEYLYTHNTDENCDNEFYFRDVQGRPYMVKYLPNPKGEVRKK